MHHLVRRCLRERLPAEIESLLGWKSDGSVMPPFYCPQAVHAKTGLERLLLCDRPRRAILSLAHSAREPYRLQCPKMHRRCHQERAGVAVIRDKALRLTPVKR